MENNKYHTFLTWAWHPILTLFLLIFGIYAVSADWLPLSKWMVELFSEITNGIIGMQREVGHKFYIIASWGLAPALAVTIYYSLRKPKTIPLRDRFLGLSCGMAIVGTITWFVLFSSLPDASQLPIGRGKFLVWLFGSSTIGLWIINSMLVWLCSLLTAVAFQSMQEIFNHH